jgi:hypothetical protein
MATIPARRRARSPPATSPRSPAEHARLRARAAAGSDNRAVRATTNRPLTPTTIIARLRVRGALPAPRQASRRTFACLAATRASPAATTAPRPTTTAMDRGAGHRTSARMRTPAATHVSTPPEGCWVRGQVDGSIIGRQRRADGGLEPFELGQGDGGRQLVSVVIGAEDLELGIGHAKKAQLGMDASEFLLE